MNKILTAICIWLTLAPVGLALAGPADLETVGLRIGQSESEVAAAIKGFDPTLKVQKVMWNAQPGVASSLSALFGANPRASFGNMDGFAEYVQATFGQATGKTYFVVRRSGEMSSSKVTTEAVVEALIKKFGPPTARTDQADGGIIRMHWTYKKDGSPAPIELCQHPDFGSFFVSQLLNTRAREECGITAMASIVSARGKIIPKEYQIAIFGHQEYIQDMKALSKLRKDHAEGVKVNDMKNATDKPRI